MNQEQIKMLIDAFAASDWSTLEFSENGCTLRLARHGGASPGTAASPGQAIAGMARRPSPSAGADAGMPPAARSEAAQSDAVPAVPDECRAPLYGVVHLRPAPGEPCFVEAGQTVSAGQTLCVIEAMKVFNEVHAPRDATLRAVLVESGQEVDAGQPLFRLG